MMGDLFEAVCDGAILQQAWLAVWGGRTAAARRRGAGVDGVTLADWEQDWPARLRALQANLQRGLYRPSPLLEFDVPRRPQGFGKPLGSETRRLAIPTVTDRVAQRAVKIVLEPIWEEVFLSCSHGFRPNRSVFTAVAHVLWHQAHGLAWAADTDIETCFDAIRHDRLLTQLVMLGDQDLLDLVAAWLAIGAAQPGCGLAQGSVISPLLANIYLHPFDVAMVQAGLALVRYADDLVILCHTAAEAQHALSCAGQALAQLDLRLNQAKTSVVPFGPDFNFLGAQFVIK